MAFCAVKDVDVDAVFVMEIGCPCVEKAKVDLWTVNVYNL
jgi:hypothetical protein